MQKTKKPYKKTNYHGKNLNNKYVDKVVDYFPRGGFNIDQDGDGDMTFNKAPVLAQNKKKVRDNQFNNDKTKLTKRKSKVSVKFSDDEEENLQKNSKRF